MNGKRKVCRSSSIRKGLAITSCYSLSLFIKASNTVVLAKTKKKKILEDIPSQFYDGCTFIMIYYTSLMSRDFILNLYCDELRGNNNKALRVVWSVCMTVARWAFLHVNQVIIFISRNTFIRVEELIIINGHNRNLTLVFVKCGWTNDIDRKINIWKSLSHPHAHQMVFIYRRCRFIVTVTVQLVRGLISCK